MSPLSKIAIVIVVAPLILLNIFSAAIFYIGPPAETTKWADLSDSGQQDIQEILPAQDGERFLYYIP